MTCCPSHGILLLSVGQGFSTGTHEQGPLINTSAVILQNPSVTVKLKSIFVDEHRPQVLGVFGRGTQTMKG